MTIDEQIEQKQLEMQKNHAWISDSEFLGEVTTTKPMKINNAKNLIEYTIHTKTKELLSIEYELLLDLKYPNKARGDSDSLKKNAEHLKEQITELKIRLGE